MDRVYLSRVSFADLDVDCALREYLTSSVSFDFSVRVKTWLTGSRELCPCLSEGSLCLLPVVIAVCGSDRDAG